MKITIRHVEDCASLAEAERRVHEAVCIAGDDADIELQLVASLEEAERSGFCGSPTILVDGSDPFIEPGCSPGLACRLYVTEVGLSGAPTVAHLAEAIRRIRGDTP